MRYPTIPENKVIELTTRQIGNEFLDDAEGVTLVGTGTDIDLNDIDTLSKPLQAELKEFRKSDSANKQDLFEGRIAGRIHETINKLPLPVLDDPGFWRYLAIKKFWWLVYWREQATFDNGEAGTFRVYVDAKKSHETIPLRIFLRGQIALRDESYELVGGDEEDTDFWRSHITRVLTWKAPTVVQTLIRSHQDKRMVTKVLRPFARRMNRRRSSLILNEYTDDEASALIAELRGDD